ncbi:MAG: PGF-pre-PGF domain-containing protein [Methanolobus sp.]|nr:PGF-pre-PGF domain-containing protein [Methanolobus sp.]
MTPVASFSADVTEGKVPLTVQFTDTSSGKPTSWLWDFGDGTTSTEKDPVHTYGAAGDFDVNLTVGNANGSDSITAAGYVHVIGTRPIVRISSVNPSDPIVGEWIHFRSEIVYNDSIIDERRWSADRVNKDPICRQHTLTTRLPVGDNTVFFKAKDSENEWSEPASVHVFVLNNTPPIATINDINPDSVPKGEEVTFSGSGTDDDGVVNGSIIHEYNWESDIDNSLSKEPNFSTSSLSVGTHTITFWVRDHYQKSKEETAIIKVIGDTEYLEVSFEKTISANHPVTITVNLNDTNPTSVGLSIVDGNGTIILAKNVTDELESGSYKFEWNATDAEGEPLQSGTYKLNLIGIDSSGEPISESMDLTVDNTAPTVFIDKISGVITHEDVVYASSELTVNVLQSDGDVRDVSVSLLSDSGNPVETIDADDYDGIWIAEFDLSSVPDGNYNVSVVAIDIANNNNSVSSDITVYVDGTAPVLEDFTPSNGQTFAVGTTSVDIRFNYSDARTGINASSIGMIVDNKDVTSNATITTASASYNATGLAAGEHSASISVTDNTGNEKMFTTSFWIGPKPSARTSSGSSSGSSSGGGGGGSTGEKYENIQVKEVQSIFVSKDSRITYEFRKEGNAVTSVQFDSLKNSGTISAVIEVLKDRSSFADTDAPGIVYQQMNIWVGKSGFVNPENVENLLIDFRVERSWLEENNIDMDSVKLYRYENNSWNSLPAIMTGNDEEYIYFESQTPGFSPFAISSEAEAGEVTDAAALKSLEDAGADAASDEAPVVIEPTSKYGFTNIMVALGGILVVLAGAYFLYRKRG